MDEKLDQVLESIRSGNYGSAAIFEPLLSKDLLYVSLNLTLAPIGTLSTDHYLLHSDFSEYLETMKKVDTVFKDKVRILDST